eukprot:gene5104-7114_t
MQTFTMKFVMVGDTRVGKSQLARNFTRKSFNSDIQATIGMEFATRIIEFERCFIKAQIWDTAGQERFESMSKAYYRDAVGAVLVYDVCNKNSLERIKNVWLNQVREFCPENIQIILVGNKIDLPQSNDGPIKREITTEEGIRFAEEEKIDFIETSALSGFAVENMFRNVILKVARKLPDVIVHLDIAALPDGWILYVLSDLSSNSKYSANNSANSGTSANSDVSSDRIEVLKSVIRSENQLEIKIGNNNNEFEIANPISNEQLINNIITNRYINYWSGEIIEGFPKNPAPSGLLYCPTDIKLALPTKSDDISKVSIDKSRNSSTATTLRISLTSTEVDSNSHPSPKYNNNKKCFCCIL